MTGVRKGVFACLQNDNPFIKNVYCANHRFALAATDTNKELYFLKDYITDISDIYSFLVDLRKEILYQKISATNM